MNFFLSIRPQEEILPSAYAQALRAKAPLEPFETYRSLWIETLPSWAALVRRILDVVPRATLSVWTLDFYARQPAKILREFSHVPTLTLDLTERPTQTVRPSAKAVAELERLRALPGGNTHDGRRAAVADNSGGQMFDPLDPQEKALLSSRFEQDMIELSQMPRVTIL